MSTDHIQSWYYSINLSLMNGMDMLCKCINEKLFNYLLCKYILQLTFADFVQHHITIDWFQTFNGSLPYTTFKNLFPSFFSKILLEFIQFKNCKDLMFISIFLLLSLLASKYSGNLYFVSLFVTLLVPSFSLKSEFLTKITIFIIP